MSDQSFQQHMKTLTELRETLAKRLGVPELTQEEEDAVKAAVVLPKLPRKLFTRAQIISLIDNVMIAGQLLYNEWKRGKSVDKAKQ